MASREPHEPIRARRPVTRSLSRTLDIDLATSPSQAQARRVYEENKVTRIAEDNATNEFGRTRHASRPRLVASPSSESLQSPRRPGVESSDLSSHSPTHSSVLNSSDSSDTSDSSVSPDSTEHRTATLLKRNVLNSQTKNIFSQTSPPLNQTLTASKPFTSSTTPALSPLPPRLARRGCVFRFLSFFFLATLFTLVSVSFHHVCGEHEQFVAMTEARMLQARTRVRERVAAAAAKAKQREGLRGVAWDAVEKLGDAVSSVYSSVASSSSSSPDVDVESELDEDLAVEEVLRRMRSPGLISTVQALKDSGMVQTLAGATLEVLCPITAPLRSTVSSLFHSSRHLLSRVSTGLQDSFFHEDRAERRKRRAFTSREESEDENEDEEDDGEEFPHRTPIESRVSYETGNPFVVVLDGTSSIPVLSSRSRKVLVERLWNSQVLTSRLSKASSVAREERKVAMARTLVAPTISTRHRHSSGHGSENKQAKTKQDESEWEKRERLDRYSKPSALTLAVYSNTTALISPHIEQDFESKIADAMSFVANYDLETISLIQVHFPSRTDIKPTSTSSPLTPESDAFCSLGSSMVIQAVEKGYAAAASHGLVPVFFFDVARDREGAIPSFCLVKAVHAIVEDAQKRLSGAVLVFPVRMRSGPIEREADQMSSQTQTSMKKKRITAAGPICDALNVWKQTQTIPEHLWSPLRARICNAVAGIE